MGRATLSGPPRPLDAFSRCPRCGSGDVAAPTVKLFVCAECGFRYYQNAAAAVICLIHDERGRILLTRRARDPAKGLLDLPGGFVDPLETAEEAARREVREELSITVTETRYLASFTNRYVFDGVLYYTLDLLFECRADDQSTLEGSDEISGIVFIAPEELDLRSIGFESVRRALRLVAPAAKNPTDNEEERD